MAPKSAGFSNTHVLCHRPRERKLGGLSNADHHSPPAKAPTPNSLMVAMETTSSPQWLRQGWSK